MATFGDHIPRKVREQLEAVEAKFKQPQEEQPQEPKQPEGDTQDGNQAEPETGPENPPGDSGDSFVNDEPKGEPEPPPKPEPSPDYEQRFKTLNGKYQAEVPRLHQANRELQNANRDLQEANRELQNANRDLQEQVRRLQEEIAELKRAESKPAEPEPPKSDTSFEIPQTAKEVFENLLNLSEEEMAQFISAMQPVIQAAVKQEVVPLQTEVTTFREGFRERQQREQENQVNQFWGRVLDAIPDYNERLADEQFARWMEDVDPLSGERRFDLAAKARDALDANRLTQFFKTYDNLHQKETSPPAAPETPSRKDKLAGKASPPKTNTAAPLPDGGKKTYTVAEYKKAMARAMQLNAREKFDEARKLADEMDLAHREGRIIP